VGGIGLMGSASGNYAIGNCEVLLIVGSNFAFKEFYPHGVPVIQIDDDPARLGVHAPVTQALLGNCQATLQELLKRVKPKKNNAFLKHAQKEKTKSTEHHKGEASEIR